MKRTLKWVAIVVVVLVVIVGALVAYDHRGSKGHPSAFTPPDTSLHHDWLYFYPSRASGSPRGYIVFFGNDVAFWEPHQDLAWRFAGDGYSVVGIDLRKYLGTLPEGTTRDRAFGASVAELIMRSRIALSADTLPVILAGHSFGAEVAFWIARYRPPPRLIGVLALNTRSTGHLFITPNDWLNKEASGPGSFSTIDFAREIDPHVRIALVRGAHDPFRGHDSAFVAAGGARIKRWEIPMAGHSLSTLLVAGPLIDRAIRFLTDTAPLDSTRR